MIPSERWSSLLPRDFNTGPRLRVRSRAFGALHSWDLEEHMSVLEISDEVLTSVEQTLKEGNPEGDAQLLLRCHGVLDRPAASWSD